MQLMKFLLDDCGCLVASLLLLLFGTVLLFIARSVVDALKARGRRLRFGAAREKGKGEENELGWREGCRRRRARRRARRSTKQRDALRSRTVVLYVFSLLPP